MKREVEFLYVDDKKSRDKTIFVFYFEDQQDFDDFISKLEELKETRTDVKAQEKLDYYIKKFKSRVDDKYQNEDSELSGCLFADEASYFMCMLCWMFL